MPSSVVRRSSVRATMIDRRDPVLLLERPQTPEVGVAHLAGPT